MAVLSSAAPGGVHGGAIVEGPSGIVTDHGPIGPAGHGAGYGGDGYFGGGYIAGPGFGYGGGHGVFGYGGFGYGGFGAGGIGVGHGGVTVKGPATVPVTIAGPAGKVVANGLYGIPTHHGHGYYGW